MELLDASGYSNRARDFDDLIRILDHELRLITPTDPEGSPNEGHTKLHIGERYYQLSHDYLVHSLRDWLTRKQRRTRRGRAELRLAERASVWNSKSENWNLPTFAEWAKILLLTQRRNWTEPERVMMDRAGRANVRKGLCVVILLSLTTWAAIEGYATLRASVLVESLQKVGTPDVPAIVEQLSNYRRWAEPRLVSVVQSTDGQSREHLHASLALLAGDPSQVDYLSQRLLSASPAEFAGAA